MRRYRGRWIRFESWYDEEHNNLSDTDLLAYLWLKHYADDEGRFEVRVGTIENVTPARFRGLWTDLLQRFRDEGHLLIYKDAGKTYAQVVEWKQDQNPRNPKPSIYPSPEGWYDRPGDEPPPPRKDKTPYMDIIRLWNDICGGALPTVDPRIVKAEPPDERLELLRKLWTGGRANLEFWQRYFTRIRRSKFLTGGVEPRKGKEPFRANLRWALEPKWMTSIQEGNYDDATVQRQDKAAEAALEAERRAREDEKKRAEEEWGKITALPRPKQEELRIKATNQLKETMPAQFILEPLVRSKMMELLRQEVSDG